MIKREEIIRSLKVSLWFVFLTFPIMAIKVDAFEKTVHIRWENMFYVAIGTFFVSLVSRFLIGQSQKGMTVKHSIQFLQSAFLIR